MFFGPPILVALAVLGPWEPGWLPRPEGPYGQRYDPPVALPEIALETPSGGRGSAQWPRAQWSLIYAGLSTCDARCVQALEVLRGAVLALPQEREYLQRVYLYGGDTDAIEMETSLTADLTMGRIDDPGAAELRRALGDDRLAGGYIYISDPGGNLVLSYPPDAEREGILDDLKRLIAISRII